MFRKLVTGEVQGAATKMDYGISVLLRCGYLTPSQLNRDNAAQAPTPTRTIRAENTDTFDAITTTTIPTTLKSTFTANGGGSGTGNGGTIVLDPYSNIKLGNNAGEFAVSATSGSTGGNGGSITVEPFGGSITVDNTASPLSVAVLGTTGNGGSITLETFYSSLAFNGTASQLTANGGTTSGNGGSITLAASVATLTIGTGSAGNVQLFAKAPGNGNGGSISITDYY